MSYETETTLKVNPRSNYGTLFLINGIAIIDVTGVKYFPVISLRENKWKLFHLCDVISCNIMNYLIRRQSKSI